jgi:hypothetical protein
MPSALLMLKALEMQELPTKLSLIKLKNRTMK